MILTCEYSSTVFDMHAGFLRVIYSRLNASVILERNETRLERNETRLERNETRLERNETHLARNETRGGNLHLSGTVVIYSIIQALSFSGRSSFFSFFSQSCPIYTN